MQIEVKLSIDSADGYARTAQTLAHHHKKDEFYYDLFFDFSYRALQERHSVLRLRVPCEPNSVASAAPAAPALTTSDVRAGLANTDVAAEGVSGAAGEAEGNHSSNSNAGYDPDTEYEAFLRACRGHSVSNGAAGSAAGHHADTASTTASTTAAGARKALLLSGLPQPIFVAGAPGKLSLKQNNIVQRGHQMNFVAEDADVPADVVEALLRLVPPSLFATGHIPAAEARPADTTLTNAFPVLSAYAQRRPRTDDGSAESPIARIVAHLTDTARAYTPAASTTGFAGKRARSESQEADAHYTQLRFSSMGARSTYTQQQLATSALAEAELEEGKDESPVRGSASGSGAAGAGAAVVPHVEAVGGFMTRRQLYAYTGVYQAVCEESSGSVNDKALRETLRLRLDTSFLLPGFAIYELEVPKCGVAVEDIAAEVSTFLHKLSVRFHTGSESKYARYVHYLAAMHDVELDAMDVKLRLTNVNGFEEVRRNLQRLTQPASTSSAMPGIGETPRSSQDKRYVSNTDVDDATAEDVDDDTWWQTNPSGYLQETNEDFFFDTPGQTLRRGQTFLRLRKQRNQNKYILVLKAHQVFSGGQQNSLSSTLELAEAVAHDLIDNPTQFLSDHRENFSLMKTIWDEFGVRELCRAATFTTERLTVPWWSAMTQLATLQRSWTSACGGGGGGGGPSARQRHSQPIYTSTSYLLSQRQQQQRKGEGGEAGAPQPPLVAPLLIHLDKTLYKIPANMKAPRAPFSQGRPWAERQLETYEIEVTNIDALTEPKAVIYELTELLKNMGVEWSVGVRSKLEQYFALLES